MKLIDKLKNMFFEEVEETEEIEIPKTFAKKVEVPKRKVNFFKDEEEKQNDKEIDKFLEEDKEESFELPKEEIQEEKEVNKTIPMMFDVDDFLEEGSVSYEKKIEKEEIKPKVDSYEKEPLETRELYRGKKEHSYNDNYSDNVSSTPAYTYTKTTYSEKKEVKGFRPSPIISPIYGILDKNYHKEEVVTKRETRISGSYNKPDLDSVRNKAFAESKKVEEKAKDKKKNDFADNDKVYDVNNSKPQVSKVTLADADEYYNDLGLAYNVDYSDASRTNTRSAKYNKDSKDKKKSKNDVDDNLFDLIDSMYSKED